MAEIKQRHRDAAKAWWPTTKGTAMATGIMEDFYAQGAADREAEIAAALRRRDAWGGGAIADRETANDIERGHESQWKNRNSAGGPRG